LSIQGNEIHPQSQIPKKNQPDDEVHPQSLSLGDAGSLHIQDATPKRDNDSDSLHAKAPTPLKDKGRILQ